MYVVNELTSTVTVLAYDEDSGTLHDLQTISTLPEDYAPDLSWKRIMVDPGDCEGCGACVLRCPNHAIVLDENGIARIDPDACLTCGYCAPVCPVRAIILC